MNDHPDHVVTHEVQFCEECHCDLSDVPIHSEDKRQVFDIIVRMETTEHRIQTKVCCNPHCLHRNQSAYPEGVD
ncbi:MAG: IS66 family transposase, partial [Bacilli bacterium]